MSECFPQGDDPRANDITYIDVVDSMMSDSIGADNPMTPAAIAKAKFEVDQRLDGALAIFTGENTDYSQVDTKAMAALILGQQEE